jgi:hypothetical protein
VSYPIIGIWYAVWLGACLGLVRTLCHWKHAIASGQILLAFTLAGIQLSILFGGVFYGHYFIQFAPALSLMAAFFVVSFVRNFRAEGLMIVFLLAMEFGYREYRDYTYLLNRQHPLAPYGRAYAVSDFLKAHNPDAEPVWLLKEQLAHFLSGSPPVDGIVHPDTFLRNYLIQAWRGPDANTRTELDRVLERRPIYIIGNEIDEFYPEPLNSYFNERLKTEYRREKDLDGLQVYRRK